MGPEICLSTTHPPSPRRTGSQLLPAHYEICKTTSATNTPISSCLGVIQDISRHDLNPSPTHRVWRAVSKRTNRMGDGAYFGLALFLIMSGLFLPCLPRTPLDGNDLQLAGSVDGKLSQS